ncbi:MAG TPA: serine/threonine-protein kinase [Vicinamibacterales bacterium]
MLGERISHYLVTGKLGVGGMGVVYEAEDTRLSRPVALKFLPEEMADDPDMARRFQREAETVALLNHPHICTIYDVGEHEGRRFIAMERCEGVNLKAYMVRAAMGTREIVDIALQITSALEAAHAKGVVHRDIKPGNIVVSNAGQVKVLDFGLARRFRVAETDGLGLEGSTILGRPLGTANYMAPERILQMPLDPRSDLFSMGVVIYEMATGRLPFAGATPSETVANVLDRDPIPVRSLDPSRPPALDAMVQRLLAKGADERYQSAAELRQALKKLTDKIPWRRLFGR